MDFPERFIKNGSDAFSSYWKPSSRLSKFLSEDISIDQADSLVKQFFLVDDLADKVVSEYLIPLGFNKGLEMIMFLVESYPNLPDDLSENTHNFLQHLYTIPDWLNQDLLLKGAKFCNKTGTTGLSVLRNYCLMGGYESSAINKPLIFTGALRYGAVKRLTDTVGFWVDVTDRNGLSLGSNGFKSVVKTRLIHSYSRIMIEKHSNWESSKWGRPLNNWDMLATNLGFSVVFLDGVSQLGINFSDEESNSVLHLWKYIGYLIGIPNELLVDNMNQAANQLFLWSRTQKGVDQDSIALANSLYREPKFVNFTNSYFLKSFVQSTNLGYNHFLIGKVSCNKLKLPKSNFVFWIYILKTINLFINSGLISKDSLIKKGRKQQIEVRDLYQRK